MENLRTIRIVLADHQLIFRDGMKSLLEAQHDFAVVGEAGGGTQTLRMVRDLHPDVLVLDMSMPGGGLAVLKKLAAMPQPVRTIALAPIADREMMMSALQHGARGVIGRESTTAMLFKSIRTAVTDQYWIGRDDVGFIVERMRRLAHQCEAEQHAKKFKLTRREMDIVTAVAAGESNKGIAERLSLSEDTVKHHVSHVFDKLGVYSRLELAVFAINHKLVKDATLPS
jgi:two-component system, NarL family, nitrate/nitrite response regulator NarL